MIARVLAAAHAAVDAGGDESWCEASAQQEMIDAHARVATPRIPQVIPKRVEPFACVQFVQSVGPAGFAKTRECGSGFRLNERVRSPRAQRVNVGIGRHDVIVAREYTGAPEFCSEAACAASRANHASL